jgi:protein TonB
VIAVHGAVVWLAHVWQTHTAMRVPQPLPMSVTLTSAPRPLPQGSPAQAATQPATPPLPTMPLEPPKPSKPQAVKPVEHRVAAPTPEARPETKRETEPATARTSAPAPNAQPSQTATQSTAQTAPTSASATQHSNIPPTSAPIGDAAYLHNPAPDYPQFAQDQGWEGRVLLRVHVLVDGSADSVSVQSSSGRRVLDDAARDAVRGWRFVPAKRGDEAVDGWVTVPIDFRLAQ